MPQGKSYFPIAECILAIEQGSATNTVLPTAQNHQPPPTTDKSLFWAAQFALLR